MYGNDKQRLYKERNNTMKTTSTAPIAYFPLDEGWGDGVKEFCGSITNYHSATGTLEWKVVPDFVSKLGMIIIVR